MIALIAISIIFNDKAKIVKFLNKMGLSLIKVYCSG